MNSHKATKVGARVICASMFLSIAFAPDASAQGPNPSSNFCEIVIDESNSYAYVRMRGTVSSPQEAVKLDLGRGDASPQFVEIVPVDSAPYQAAAAHTKLNDNSDRFGGVLMKDGCRFVYSYQQATVEKQAAGSQDGLGKIRIPDSPGNLRSAGCVLKDELRGHVYVGTARGPADSAQIVKIQAGEKDEPPTLVGAITLEANESNVSCGVIDPVNGYAYFGTSRHIVKVALGGPLEPPSRVGAISLESHESNVKYAAIDLEQRFAYFANDDSFIKISLGDGLTPPQRVGAMTLQKPKYGEYTSYLLLPIVLPLVLAFVLPAAKWRGKTLKQGLLLVFLASMLAAVIQLQWFGIRALFGSFLAIPPITVPFFFLLPLCQTFLDAMAAGRRALDERSDPWQQFRRSLVPSALLWAILWISYISLHEVMMLYIGGGIFITSAICLTLVFGMFTGCLIWAPRFRTLGGLALASVLWTLASSAAFMVAAVPLVALLNGGGYMGLGYLFFIPLVAITLQLLSSLFCGIIAMRSGDAWFACTSS